MIARGKPSVSEQDDGVLARDDFAVRLAVVSTALVTVFRGKFCDAILTNRKVTTFEKGDVIYDLGGTDRTFFFLLNGLVKVGTITPEGHELIYDVRKGGDVVGELVPPNASARTGFSSGARAYRGHFGPIR